MKLYPKGDTPEAAGYLSVYLSNQVKFKPLQWAQGSEDSMTTAVLTVKFSTDWDGGEGKIRVHNLGCLQEQTEQGQVHIHPV